MGILRVKNGVTFEPIAPAGFRILGSLDRVTRETDFDLTITCGSDSHPATMDPHTRGMAYDIRTHGLTEAQKLFVLREVMLDLADGPDDAPVEKDGGLVTRRWFGQLEHKGESNEHLHVQLRRQAIFP